MIREYWDSNNGWMVYLSSDEENKDLIIKLWPHEEMTYFKRNQPVGHHFKVSKRQLNKLPLNTFKAL